MGRFCACKTKLLRALCTAFCADRIWVLRALRVAFYACRTLVLRTRRVAFYACRTLVLRTRRVAFYTFTTSLAYAMRNFFAYLSFYMHVYCADILRMSFAVLRIPGADYCVIFSS